MSYAYRYATETPIEVYDPDELDSIYARLDATNQPFTGAISAPYGSYFGPATTSCWAIEELDLGEAGAYPMLAAYSDGQALGNNIGFMADYLAIVDKDGDGYTTLAFATGGGSVSFSFDGTTLQLTPGEVGGYFLTTLPLYSLGNEAAGVYSKAIAGGSGGTTAVAFGLEYAWLGDGHLNDGIRLEWKHRNTNGLLGTAYTAAYIDCIQDDNTPASEDATLKIGGITAGALADWLTITGAEADFQGLDVTTTGEMHGGLGSAFGSASRYWSVTEIDLGAPFNGIPMLCATGDFIISSTIGAIADFLVIYDNSASGYATLAFVGNLFASSCTLQFDGTDLILSDADLVPSYSGGANLGSSSSAWQDIWVDASGHVYFRDSNIYINSADDGHLDLWADTAIDLNGHTYIGTASNYKVAILQNAAVGSGGQLAMGVNSSVASGGSYGIAMGVGATVTNSGSYGIAIGRNTVSDAERAITIGDDFTNSVADSIALGIGSKVMSITSTGVSITGTLSATGFNANQLLYGDLEQSAQLYVDGTNGKLYIGDGTKSQVMLVMDSTDGNRIDTYISGVQKWLIDFMSTSVNFFSKTLNSNVMQLQDDGDMWLYRNIWMENGALGIGYDGTSALVAGLQMNHNNGILSMGTLASGYQGYKDAVTAMQWNPYSASFRVGRCSNGTAWDTLGTYSFAAGLDCVASGQSSMSLGQINTASGNFSVALGFDNDATAAYSYAIGNANTAQTNQNTFCFGYSNTASANPSMALGFSCVASGGTSMAIGNTATANQTRSIVISAGTRNATSDTTNQLKLAGQYVDIDASTYARIGDGTNYARFGSNGDLAFIGSAGFYPRKLSQSAEPAAGTGDTQLDTGEMCIWTDTDDSKTYLCYNDGGTVKTVELT